MKIRFLLLSVAIIICALCHIPLQQDLYAPVQQTHLDDKQAAAGTEAESAEQADAMVYSDTGHTWPVTHTAVRCSYPGQGFRDQQLLLLTAHFLSFLRTCTDAVCLIRQSRICASFPAPALIQLFPEHFFW